MSVELAIALISAVVAFISVIIGIYGQTRTTKLEHELAIQRELESRDAKAKELVAKYRDPLLRAAVDLQSRLYSCVQLNFLRIYYHRNEADKAYAVNNTLFVIAEYFGWVEVLRREIQFLDLGSVEANQQLGELLQRISQAFLTDAIELTFRLFRGEQRAIGEIMLRERKTAGDRNLECLGFAEFVKKLEDPDFERWFIRLRNDIEQLAIDPEGRVQRLVVTQHALIDLINFLDPDFIRVSKRYRNKIKL